MAFESTIPTAIDNLKAMLEEASGLAGVSIRSAGPNPDDAAREQVVILGTLESSLAWVFLSRDFANESYDLGCVIDVVSAGGGEESAKRARDRAFAIWNSILQTIRADTTLDGAIQACTPILTNFDQPINLKGDRLAQISFTVRVDTAQLSV